MTDHSVIRTAQPEKVGFLLHDLLLLLTLLLLLLLLLLLVEAHPA